MNLHARLTLVLHGKSAMTRNKEEEAMEHLGDTSLLDQVEPDADRSERWSEPPADANPFEDEGAVTPPRILVLSVAAFDALAGLATLVYGLAVIARGIGHGRTPPISAVSVAVAYGCLLTLAASPLALIAPIIVAVCDLAAASFALTRPGGVSAYLEENREAMLISESFAAGARESGYRFFFCGMMLALAIAELWRSASVAHTSRRSFCTNERGELGRRDDGRRLEVWAERNATRWEQWKKSCDPLLRDRTGEYDLDVVHSDDNLGFLWLGECQSDEPLLFSEPHTALNYEQRNNIGQPIL